MPANRQKSRRRPWTRQLQRHWTTKPWTKPLTRKQQHILQDARDWRDTMEKKWHNVSSEVVEANETFKSHLNAFNQAMEKAVSAGLKDHPDVYPWYCAQRGLGNRCLLRKYKRVRAEKGVRRRLQLSRELYDRIVQLAKEGRSWGEIQKELRLSRQSFYRLRKHLCVPPLSEIRRKANKPKQ